jgi:glutaredoxin
MIYIYYLDGCYYSNNALQQMIQLNKSKLTSKEIDKLNNQDFVFLKKKKNLKVPFNVELVYHRNKSAYKRKNKMMTFPQIFNIEGKRRTKIGGNDDIEQLFSEIRYRKQIETKIKNKGLSKKTIDRISLVL